MSDDEYKRRQTDTVRFIANVILRMDEETRAMLREALEDDDGNAGVAAVIPPNLPLREGAVEVPFEKWPDEYWESQA